jgi:hypothetical protein
VLCRWENAFIDDRQAQRNCLRVVKTKYRNRASAYRRPTDQYGPSPSKTSLPLMAPGMEELNELSSPWIKPANVRPFEAVAVEASQGEVLGNGPSAVLLGDDVVDLERQQRIQLRQPAVFTAQTRPLPNELDKLRVHGPPFNALLS